jgi:hypothetical protein
MTTMPRRQGRKFFYNYRNGPHYWATYFNGKSCVLILAKTGWATFWTIFSQTHQVNLSPSSFTAGPAEDVQQLGAGADEARVVGGGAGLAQERSQDRGA